MRRVPDTAEVGSARLAQLVDMSVVQRLANASYRANRMPIGIIDAVDGSILVGCGWQDICVLFHRANPVSAERCRESDDHIKANLSDHMPCEYKCKNGLRDIGVPIIASGTHLATLFLGQFFYEGESPDRDFFVLQARELGFDEESYLAALDRVPVFARRSVENIIEYNKVLARFIGDLADRARQSAAAEKALRESEERARSRAAELEALFDAVPAAIFITRDRDVRYMEGNQLAFEALRQSRGANLSKSAPLGEQPVNFRAKRRGADLPADDLPLQVAARGVPVRNAEFDLHFDDGVVRCFLGNATPLVGVEGQSYGAVGAFIDVTELRRAEEALREADRRKSEFLAVLSHELRNPLAPIRNSLYILDHVPPGSDQASRAKAVIDRQVGHLTRLVDDLLDVTRISRGKVELERALIDLKDLVRRTCEDHHSTFAERGIALRIDVPADPIWIDADATRIAQIMGNLLHNAAKFTPRGGKTIVMVAAVDDRAELRVRDDGIGIDPAQLDRMFEPFQQADPGLARTRGGLGLGLALVKALAELHGGSVRASSEGLNHGSEFVVALPLVPAPARDGASMHRDAASSRAVLIIEDNPDAGQSLAEVLALSGHRPYLASDGRSGIAKARELRPDVVLCDIGLPDIDGYEVARTLRADEAFRSTVLVALSGYAQPEDRQRAFDEGFDAHLPKPPPLGELEQWLGNRA